MIQLKHKLVVVLSIPCVVCCPTWAQQPKDSVRVHDLKVVEVVAFHGSCGITDVVPGSVLNRENIANMGITDIADALHRMPGVNLRDYGGAGGMKTIGVRGFGAQHTGVSYDGFMLSDTQSGSVDVSRYALDNIESLTLSIGGENDVFLSAREVSSAALFRMTTLTDLPADHRVHLQTQLKFGSFGYVSPFVYYVQSVSNRVTLSANGEYIYAENDYPFTLRNGIYKTHGRRNNSRMNSGHGELNAYILTGRYGEIDGKVYYYDNSRLLPGIAKYYSDINGESLHDRNGFAQLGWRQHAANGLWSWKAKGKFNWSSSRYRDKYSPNHIMDADYWQREAYGSLAAMFTPTDGLSFAFASDYVFNNLNSSLATDVRPFRHTLLESFSVKYVTPRLVLLGRALYSVYLNGAERGEAAKNGRKLSPSFSLSYRPFSSEQFYVRTSYKNIFRAPTFNENYFFHFGSPRLKPETTDQLNLGVTWQKQFSNRFNLEITADGYLNHIKDKIVAIPYNMFIWTNVNIGRVQSKGVEVSLRGDYQLAEKHNLLFFGGYSYQNVTDREDKSLPDYGKQIAYIPLHSVSGSVKWGNPWVDVVVHGVGYGSRWASNSHYDGTRLDGYFDMGLTCSHRFVMKHGEFSLRGDIKNILNQQYEIVGNYPMPGVSYQFVVNYKF